jgi:hypothetical protein
MWDCGERYINKENIEKSTGLPGVVGHLRKYNNAELG